LIAEAGLALKFLEARIVGAIEASLPLQDSEATVWRLRF